MIRCYSNPLVLYIIQTHINVYKCTLKLTHTELSDIRHNISNTIIYIYIYTHTYTRALKKREGECRKERE